MPPARLQRDKLSADAFPFNHRLNIRGYFPGKLRTQVEEGQHIAFPVIQIAGCEGVGIKFEFADFIFQPDIGQNGIRPVSVREREHVVDDDIIDNAGLQIFIVIIHLH